MGHTDYRTLIDRGRKSGLKTSELYSALTARQPQPGDYRNGQTDGNGFVPAFDQQGHPVYKPREGQNQ